MYFVIMSVILDFKMNMKENKFLVNSTNFTFLLLASVPFSQDPIWPWCPLKCCFIQGQSGLALKMVKFET